MIADDKELEQIINDSQKESSNQVVVKEKDDRPSLISHITEQTKFNEAVDTAKLNILKEASVNDEKFVTEVKSNVKDATIKLTEVEKEKAELEKQNVLYYQELKDKARQINEFEKKVNYWENRQKRREYHFNGVKPIMNFVGIKEPMNLFVLYFLTIVLVPFFLLAKLLKGTFGVLIAGASDGDRPKMVRGVLWTLLAISLACVIAGVIFLFLKWQNII